jgi:serine/threonine-protein kinase
MLIGQRPFRGGNFTEIAYGVLNEPPAGGAELATVAGPDLQSAIYRALAKRPEDRFVSAAAMADALRHAVGGFAPQASPADVVDKTLLAVRARGKAPPVGTPFDQTLLSGIERGLARHVGPIARYLVQTSIRTAASLEDLCSLLAQRIDHPDARQRFLSEALNAVNNGATGPLGARLEQSQRLAPSLIAGEEIERAQRALAETLGPIAGILVQRALRQAQTSQELWNLLAAHIGSVGDRADFLRRVQRR